MAVANQLCDNLHRNGLFEDFQSGFRFDYSTETALVKVSNDILMASDNRLACTLVLFDLSAAFDTNDQRLEQENGIKGSVLRFFKSHLSDSYWFVHVNNSSFSRIIASHGVPQGSVL